MTNSDLRYGINTRTWEMIISVFQSNPLVTEVILFGSRAKGNFKPGSDIDICLKGTNITYIVLKNLQTELDNLDLPWTIDLLHYESIPDPVVIEHIDRVGIKLV